MPKKKQKNVKNNLQEQPHKEACLGPRVPPPTKIETKLGEFFLRPGTALIQFCVREKRLWMASRSSTHI